ncbi:MAG: anthranilate synthase component I family protein, partial [Nitrospinae bacterium]|nr:anthranilate synthase component I family protein [Nitrospinota bacterium]
SFAPAMTADAYRGAVERVREYIAAGDVYQVNLSQRFEGASPLAPADAWLSLRRVSPAPYGAYIALDDGAILSTSPERFLSVDAAGFVESRPIKGTAPRGATPQEDRQRAEALAASEKERAENVMIVDLIRNDLSRVCRPGSVAVPSLCAVERFATVIHLTSTVTGRLREGAGFADLMRAAFPCGSVTGAPKIR